MKQGFAIPLWLETARPLFPTGRIEIGLVTLLLLLGAGAVSVWFDFGDDPKSRVLIYITEIRMVGDKVAWQWGLPEIRDGQVWRLVTPFFLHYSVSHLLINAFLIWIYGTLIEKRQGKLCLVLCWVAFEVISNGAQHLAGGPYHAGMSGVIDGLVGFIWVRGWLDPASGLKVHPFLIGLPLASIVLFSLGFFGLSGDAAHYSGLAAGMIWGGITSAWARRTSKLSP